MKGRNTITATHIGAMWVIRAVVFLVWLAGTPGAESALKNSSRVVVNTELDGEIITCVVRVIAVGNSVVGWWFVAYT